MTLRKHKNNRTFLISFSTRSASRTETHLNSDGTTRRVHIPVVGGPVQRVWATGSCKQSVLRAFLFGRDAGNISPIIREATPLVNQWTGRLVIS